VTTLANIVRQAQEALESHQPPKLDPVEIARNYFGAVAWAEIDEFRTIGKLPETIRGLELLELDIRLDEEI